MVPDLEQLAIKFAAGIFKLLGCSCKPETVQVMNKDGFMSVEVKKGKNVVFFEFNNKRLDLNMKLLSEFITNDR